MANEEALFVVISVNEPAGDAVGAVADHFTGLRLKDIHAIYLDPEVAILLGDEVDIRLAQDDEEIALAGILEIFGHVEVGVHAGLEHWYPPKLSEFRGVRFVIEGAGDQNIECSIAGLAGGGDEIGALDRAELRTDEDGGAFLGLAFHVPAVGANQIAGPRGERGEVYPVVFVCLLDSRNLEVFQNHLGERFFSFGTILPKTVNQLIVLVYAQHAMGAETLHGEGTGDADLFLVVVRFVVEVFKFGLGGEVRPFPRNAFVLLDLFASAGPRSACSEGFQPRWGCGTLSGYGRQPCNSPRFKADCAFP